MLIKADPTHTIHENFDAWTYNHEFEKFSLSGATIVDRYPAKGFAYNVKSEIIFFIFDGQVTINMADGESFNLVRGDIFVLPINTKYSMRPYNCEEYSVWMVCSPHFEQQSQKFSLI